MSFRKHRNEIIESFVGEFGLVCQYCNCSLRIRQKSERYTDRDATVDHIVARSKGGTNERPNLTLACRECNHAKEDRDLSDFLRDPRPRHKRDLPRIRRVKTVPIPLDTAIHSAYKVRAGTLAAAIEAGDLAENGTYRRVRSPDGKLRPSKSARRMTAFETAQYLRASAEASGRSWPLA